MMQVSRDRRRLLTATVRHLFSVVYCYNDHCLETVQGLTAANVSDHSTAVICFVQKRWLTGFTLTLVVTYSETDSVKFKDTSVAYNVRKSHFQANLCEVFAGNKQQHYCGDLVLGWVVLQKTVFNH